MLGPGEGPFELGIESFDCVNVDESEADYLLESRRKRALQDPSIAFVMSRDKVS